MTYRKSIMAECYRACNSAPLSPDYNREDEQDDICLQCGDIPILGTNANGLCQSCQDKINQDDAIQFINPFF